MSEDKKKLEVVFAPGCFDEFDGTQEELDELMKQIMEMAENGTLEENSTPINLEDFDLEDFDLEDLNEDTNIKDINPGRKLH